MNFVQPETWSDGVYFCLGAATGIWPGLAVGRLLDAGPTVAWAVVAGATLLLGVLAVRFRDDFVEVLIKWFRWWRNP
jgi:hypothetical protein